MANLPQASNVVQLGGPQNGNNPSAIPFSSMSTEKTITTGTDSLTTGHYYSFSEVGQSGFYTVTSSKTFYAPGFWYIGANGNNLIQFGTGTSGASADSSSAPTGDSAPGANNKLTLGSTSGDWVWYPFPIHFNQNTQPYVKLLGGTATNYFRVVIAGVEQ